MNGSRPSASSAVRGALVDVGSVLREAPEAALSSELAAVTRGVAEAAGPRVPVAVAWGRPGLAWTVVRDGGEVDPAGRRVAGMTEAPGLAASVPGGEVGEGVDRSVAIAVGDAMVDVSVGTVCRRGS